MSISSHLGNATAVSKNETSVTGNSSSAISYEWEYYYDYLDPVIVHESKLKYNKYSIVIILWISLAAFVGFLFLSLNLMSLRGKWPEMHKLKPRRHHRGSNA